MKIKLPTKKDLKGQRLGQLIINIFAKEVMQEVAVKGLRENTLTATFLDKLYFMETSDLQKKINNYLKKVGK